VHQINKGYKGEKGKRAGKVYFQFADALATGTVHQRGKKEIGKKGGGKEEARPSRQVCQTI